jgi:AcrR family transcriptional regulator
MKSRKVRRRYHHGDLKKALIDAALEQIARDGIRALSLRELARRTGVSHTASYRHFPSKESLLAAIAEQGFRRLSASMRAAMLPQARDPVAALKASGVAYVEFAVSHPDHLNVMFSVRIASADYPGLAEAAKEAYALLTSTVEEGVRAGGLRRADERTITLAAWSIVHGLAQLITGGQLEGGGRSASTTREIAVAVTAMLHEGIAVTPARDTRKTRRVPRVKAKVRH